MTPIYTTTFSPTEAFLYLSFLAFFVYGLFVYIPGVKRKKETECGLPPGVIRVVASFGDSSLRWGGAFYRVSLYDKCVVICFFSAKLYSYRQVRFRKPYRKNSCRLELVIKNTPISLYGNSIDLGRFVDVLSERKALDGG